MAQDIFDQITARQPNAAEQSRLEPSETTEAIDETACTPLAVRQCCQELLKYGLLEMDKKPRLYQIALTQQPAVSKALEPFDLGLSIDDIRGLAFLVVADSLLDEEQGDEWSHPLVRRQRLTLEQSLLVAILRKHFLNHEQENGVGAGDALLYIDDLIPELQIYLGDLGSDSKEQTRLRNLLEKLKGHGIVSEIDQRDQLVIRPIIAHLASPQSLKALLQQYRRLANNAESDS
jgi:hypothetical protein